MADDTYTVTRSVTMAARPHRVFEHLIDFHRWATWSPWEQLDPGMRRTYSGTPSGVGTVYRWSGNRKAGQGRMEITEVKEPRLVRIDLAFEKPWRSQTETRFVIEPAGSGSKVTWTITGPKTLMTRIMGIFTSMDKMIGPDFEKGLAQLRAKVEEPTNN